MYIEGKCVHLSAAVLRGQRYWVSWTRPVNHPNWELHSDPLQEQCPLLTTSSSLRLETNNLETGTWKTLWNVKCCLKYSVNTVFKLHSLILWKQLSESVVFIDWVLLSQGHHVIILQFFISLTLNKNFYCDRKAELQGMKMYPYK